MVPTPTRGHAHKLCLDPVATPANPAHAAPVLRTLVSCALRWYPHRHTPLHCITASPTDHCYHQPPEHPPTAPTISLTTQPQQRGEQHETAVAIPAPPPDFTGESTSIAGALTGYAHHGFHLQMRKNTRTDKNTRTMHLHRSTTPGGSMPLAMTLVS